MFEWELSGVKLRVCFSFFAVVSLTCLLGDAQSSKMLIMLACCCLHELGHIAAMMFFGCKPSAVTFYGGGIKLVPPKHLSSFAQDGVILVSGCAVNFLLAFAGCVTSGEMTFFSQVNLLLGGFNLLPVGYLDGGRLIDLAFDGRIARTVKIIFSLLVALLVVTALLCGNFSVSLLCVLSYMCLSIFTA